MEKLSLGMPVHWLGSINLTLTNMLGSRRYVRYGTGISEEQTRAAPKWFIQWVATPLDSAFCQGPEGLLYLSKRVNKGKYFGEKMNSVVGLRSTKSN